MESGGRRDNAGGDGADNVIRFPRDWFGSTDDLVPFGPAADRLEAAAAAQREQRREDDLDDALTADDFWGEGAGALHQPVGVPGVEDRRAPGFELAEPPRRLTRADRTLAASSRRAFTVPSRHWLSGTAVAVMLICAVAIFLLGRIHSAPGTPHAATSRAAAVHASAPVAPGIDLSRRVDLLVTRGMREAAQAVAVVERLRPPVRRRRPKARHPAETAKRVKSKPHAAVTTASRDTVQPVSETQPASVSGSTDADAVTVAPSSVKPASSSTDSSPPVRTSEKRSSTSSSTGASLPPGPTSAGSSGSNCNPQCK